LKRSEVASLIDHTLLKAGAVPSQVERLCDEARQYAFAAVCINPVYVTLAARRLSGSGVAVCSVAGFPLGAATPAIKLQETQQAIDEGATEVDMVIHLGALKAGQHDAVQEEIAALAEACHAGGVLLKVIIEAPLLDKEQKTTACLLAKAAQADYVKTSTGFGGSCATVDDVRLMRQTVGPRMGVKAAGGIRTYEAALAMIEAGASRIGTSSGVAIAEQAPV
jgi:deoxyribose-phosphate aldolase